MKLQINKLTKSERFKAAYGIFNLVLRFNGFEVHIGRGSLSAISSLKFFPRIKTENCVLAEIGAFCEFADCSILLGGEHPLQNIHLTFGSSLELMLTINPELFKPTSNGLIKIGPCNVFSFKTIILSGVALEHNCIVGAGALVKGSYAAFSKIVGVPGKAIGKRITEDRINYLNNNKWWNASYDWIANSLNSIQLGEAPKYKYVEDAYKNTALIIDIQLEDAKISSLELNGYRINGIDYKKSQIPKNIIDYFDHFNGTGPITIDTDILKYLT
jgi:hypothetical protein